MKRIESETSALTSISSKSPKGKGTKSKITSRTAEEECRDMVEIVVDLVYKKTEESNKKAQDLGLVAQSISELIQLHDMYMKTYNMHKDNGTLTDEKKNKMLGKVEEIMDAIEEKTQSRMRPRDESVVGETNNNSNTVS